jgi:hypothetical protein
MIKAVLAILILSFNVFSGLKNNSHSGTEYFEMFNYNDSSKHSRMLELEASMVNLSEEIIIYMEKNPEYQSVSKKLSSRNQLAMFLVYTSMLLMNNNNGAIEGIISMEVLNSKLNLPIKARYELSEKYLKFARFIEPNDERLEAWHSSNLLRMQKYIQGKVDEETLDWIIDITKESPIFNLFNALTMSSDYDFGKEREKVLFEVVELMNSKDSPCFPPIKFLRKGEAKKCNTTKKTPFAMQGTSVYMGDVYLKKAAKVDSNEEAQLYLKKALSTYRRPKMFKLFKTRKWNLKRNLQNRINLVKEMQQGHQVPKGFFKTREYLDIYTCRSCHQNGKARKSLHINLP